MPLVVHVHSPVLRVVLLHHAAAFKTIVHLVRNVWLELLLELHHVQVDGREVLGLNLLVLTHTTHVEIRLIQAADVVDRAVGHNHNLIDPVAVQHISLHEASHIVVVVTNHVGSARTVSYHILHVVALSALAKHLRSSQHALATWHPWA